MNMVVDLPAPIPLAGLTSRCDLDGFRAPDRADPYYHNLWMGGAAASWVSGAAMRRLRRDGVAAAPPREAHYTPGVARRELWDRRRTDRLTGLAAVQLWRTLTAQQLVTVTGLPAAVRDDFLAAAVHAGLVDRGTFLSELAGRHEGHHNRLFRPGTRDMFETFAAGLDYHERVGVTAGQPWSCGGQYDRHNILAAELALRVAEYTDVAMALGELLCRRDMLAADRPGRLGGTADAVLIRPDGYRVAVELTSSFGENTVRKVELWARLLATVDARRVGLSVVFVEAANLHRPADRVAAVYTGLRSAVGRAALGSPDTVRAGVPQRMAVARWREWFPDTHCCSRMFLGLAGLRPTGPHSRRWEPVRMLDPAQVGFDPVDPDAARVFIRNARLLAGAPFWLRERQPRPPGVYTAALLRHGGLDGPIDPTPRALVRAHRRARASAAGPAR